jgi:hypothetical protein
MLEFNARPAAPKERQLNLKPFTDLSGLGGASDGNGWFVSAIIPVGKRIMFIDPDGLPVAYLNRIERANGWMVDLR